MKMLFSAALCVAMVIGAGAATAQEGTEGNGTPVAQQFPLAAPAGVDSHAATTAPAGAVNTAPASSWGCKARWANIDNVIDCPGFKMGPIGQPVRPAMIWNPVKAKMIAGQKVTSDTLFYPTDPASYCTMANSGVDFIWTEMQHDGHTWEEAQQMWAACPHARAVPGARIPLTDEFQEQHALDEGALVLVVPTVRSLQEGQLAANWAFWPPLGDRSAGGGQATTAAFWANCCNAGGNYRNTFNDNLVLIFMIESLGGAQAADQIAKIPGLSAIFAASSDLGNRSGYRQGDPDYERLINMVHDAAINAHIRLCGPGAWFDRPDFTCFQGGPTNQPLGVVTMGPYAPNWTPPPAPGRGRRG